MRIAQPSPFAAPGGSPPEPEPPPRKRSPPLTRAQKARILRLAASGMAPAAIGRATGIHRQAVSRVLRKAGKLPPPSGHGGRARALTEDQTRKALTLRRSGASWSLLSAEFGVAPATVRRAIRRLEDEG